MENKTPMFIQTKKEMLKELLLDFFSIIGIDPKIGFAIIATLLLLNRVRVFYKKKKRGDKRQVTDIYQDVLVTIIFVVIIIFILSPSFL